VTRLADIVRRNPRFNILAFTITVLIAVAALEIADLWWRRDNALKNAETRAANLDRVLAEYVRGSFASADAALRQLQVHGRRIGGSSAAKEDWDSILGPARAALPEIGSISVTDRQGTVTHSTVPIVGQSRRDNYVFRRLVSTDEDALVVDRPYLSPRQGQYIIPVGRRLLNDAGRFDGTVVATLIPEGYRQFIRSISVGQDGNISVIHPEGVVLFREPSAENPINEADQNNPLLALAARHESGIYRGTFGADPRVFITSYRTVPGPDLIVAVSLSESDMLADWRRQARVAAAAFGSLTVTLGLIVAALFRVVHARERAERDLAEMQRVEAERLRVANEQLADALEREQKARRDVEAASLMKDEFLMTVSHELRTPLTAIYGWARVLATREMPRDEQVRALAAIERNSYAQTRLIDDLLDVSRAISGKLRLEPRPVNIEDVVRTAVETVTPALTAKGLDFEASYEPDLPSIVADPDRLQQIVWNLLSNAAKFTPEGGRVALRVAGVDGAIEIAVSDSGAGIAPDFLPHVFERFRQGDTGTRRRYGGLGLGLAIVRHLVELHGGTVIAESPGEGLGATFRVRIPVTPNSQASARRTAR
jgi:signal transduction histidine kinase